jgi:hypothetical protein
VLRFKVDFGKKFEFVEIGATRKKIAPFFLNGSYSFVRELPFREKASTMTAEDHHRESSAAKVRQGSSVANIILGEFQPKKLDYDDRSWNLAYLEVNTYEARRSGVGVGVGAMLL